MSAAPSAIALSSAVELPSSEPPSSAPVLPSTAAPPSPPPSWLAGGTETRVEGGTITLPRGTMLTNVESGMPGEGFAVIVRADGTQVGWVSEYDLSLLAPCNQEECGPAYASPEQIDRFRSLLAELGEAGTVTEEVARALATADAGPLLETSDAEVIVRVDPLPAAAPGVVGATRTKLNHLDGVGVVHEALAYDVSAQRALLVAWTSWGDEDASPTLTRMDAAISSAEDRGASIAAAERELRALLVGRPLSETEWWPSIGPIDAVAASFRPDARPL